MKVGDLVKACYLRDVEPETPLLGIILAEVSGKTSTADNDVFRVQWICYQTDPTILLELFAPKVQLLAIYHNTRFRHLTPVMENRIERET